MSKWIRILWIAMLSLVLTSCGNAADQHPGEAKTPADASIMERRSYTEVQDDFQERGFTNIRLEKIEDLVPVAGWRPVAGNVEEVLVDGEANYEEDQWIPEDTEIVIRYHTYPEPVRITEPESTPDDSSADAENPEAGEPFLEEENRTDATTGKVRTGEGNRVDAEAAEDLPEETDQTDEGVSRQEGAS